MDKMWKENVDNNKIKMTQDDNALLTLKEIKVAKNAMKKNLFKLKHCTHGMNV